MRQTFETIFFITPINASGTGKVHETRKTLIGIELNGCGWVSQEVVQKRRKTPPTGRMLDEPELFEQLGEGQQEGESDVEPDERHPDPLEYGF